MGRRKKRTRKILRPRKTLPRVFICPHCGSRMLTISIRSRGGRRIATATCGKCGFRAEIEVPAIYQAVDAYGMILDRYNNGTLEYEIAAPEERGGEEWEESGEEE